MAGGQREKPKKLLEQVHEILRLHHYATRHQQKGVRRYNWGWFADVEESVFGRELGFPIWSRIGLELNQGGGQVLRGAGVPASSRIITMGRPCLN
jgi:hypothetical protein